MNILKMNDILKESKDLVNDFSKNISERIKLPIVFVYILVFIAYHWDFLFVLFFKKEMLFLRYII